MTGDRKIIGIRKPAGADNGSAPVVAEAADRGDAASATVTPHEHYPEDPYLPDATDAFGQPLTGPDRVARALGLAVAAGVVAWIAASVWQHSDGYRVLPSGLALVVMLQQILPALMLGAIAFLLFRRLSPLVSERQISAIERIRVEYGALDDRLQAMQAHWRDADRALQSRAEALSGVGLDTVARLHDASAALEASLQRCTGAAASLAEQSAIGQRQLDSLSIAVPRIEEITARLSDNLRIAGQSAYQFGGQLEALIANIAAESATAGSAMNGISDELQERIDALKAAAAEAQDALTDGSALLETAAQRQRDQALTLLAEFAASANEATSQSASQIASVRAAAAAQHEAETAALAARLAEIDAATLTLRTALQDAAVSAASLQGELASEVAATCAQLASLESEGRERMAALGGALQLLTDGMTQFRDRAAAGDEQAVALIDRAQTLLIAMDAATRQIDVTVPSALLRLNEHVASAEQSIAQLEPLSQAEHARIADIEARLKGIAATLSAQQGQMATLAEAGAATVSQRHADLAALETGIEAIERRLAALSDGTIAQFSERLAAVERDAGDTLGRTEAAVERLVTAASEQAASDIGAAIDRVAGAGINDRLAAMSAHADQAVAAAAAASDRLMRQLITIADSSAALEQRAQEVAALSAGVERETLARQMTLLGEALQSTAVDLTRILDMDVADQAWDAYLKGDRSIFARRAARLLSNAEARDLLRRYESDDSFKAQVNRYIHDFETMLRGVMDTRDGHALSVTLLSSDIGKLYVALAQAIERLRR